MFLFVCHFEFHWLLYHITGGKKIRSTFTSQNPAALMGCVEFLFSPYNHCMISRQIINSL